MIRVEVTPPTGKSKREIDAWLKAMEAEFDYAMGEAKKKLQTEPSYKYVPWKRVGGPVKGGFHSIPQRNLVMMMVRRGVWGKSNPYKRTGRQKSSWVSSKQRRSAAIVWKILLDEKRAPRGRYVQGSNFQHRRMRMIGWETPRKIMNKYLKPELKSFVRRLG